MKVLLDTNIIIDFLAGKKEAIQEVYKYSEIYISIISYMEVMIGVNEPDFLKLKDFFANVSIVNIDNEIADIAISLRKTTRIKLPDAIVLATSTQNNLLLLTRDEAPAFKSHPYIRYPYKI